MQNLKEKGAGKHLNLSDYVNLMYLFIYFYNSMVSWYQAADDDDDDDDFCTM